MQVTGNVAGCSHAVQDLPPFKMDAANTTAHELCKCSLRVNSSDTRNAQSTDGCQHGARAATASPCCSCQQAVPANCATILAHMAMNKGRGNAAQNRGW